MTFPGRGDRDSDAPPTRDRTSSVPETIPVCSASLSCRAAPGYALKVTKNKLQLLRRGVIERRALVDDVDGDDFQRLVADDLEAGMRHVAQVDRA